MRANTIEGYVEGMQSECLADIALHRKGSVLTAPVNMQIRYWYNPGVVSVVAMVPAVIPMLLLVITAIVDLRFMMRLPGRYRSRA